MQHHARFASSRTCFAQLSLSLIFVACTPTSVDCPGAKTAKQLEWVLEPSFGDLSPSLLRATATTVYFLDYVDGEFDLRTEIMSVPASSGARVQYNLLPSLVLARETDLLVGTKREVENPDVSIEYWLDLKRFPYDGTPVSTLASYRYDASNGPVPAALLPDGENVLVVDEPYDGGAATSVTLKRITPDGAVTSLGSVSIAGELPSLTGGTWSGVRVADVFYTEEFPTAPSKASEAFKESYTETRIRSFGASAAPSQLLDIDAPLVRIIGSTQTDLLLGTLKPTSTKDVYDVGFQRLTGGATPGTPITLEGKRAMKDLDPVAAPGWPGAPGSVFSPDGYSLYLLRPGETEAKRVVCFSDALRVSSIVGNGSVVYAVMESENEGAGIARFNLPL
jgi:hypothetical protein